jgi:hypothetical protein
VCQVAKKPSPIRRSTPRGLRLQGLYGTIRPPAGVELLVRAHTGGEPYTGTELEDLLVTEDGHRLDRDDTAFLPQRVGTARFTVLLVDMSGNLVDSGRLTHLTKGLHELVDNLPRDHAVCLAAFDGRPKLQLLQTFTKDRAKLRKAISALSRFQVKDSSCNLFGAMNEAVKLLQKQRSAIAGRLVLRSVVIFSGSGDRANRVSHDALYRMIENKLKSGFLFFAIGLGSGADPVVVEEMGQTEHFTFEMVEKWAADGAKRVSSRLKKHWASHFVLSVCSQKRGGSHTLAIAPVTNPRSAVEFTYEADTFSGGCRADWHRSDCRLVECGGPEDTSCRRCPAGLACHRGQCVETEVARKRQRELEAANRRAKEAYEKKKKRFLEEFRRCQKRRERVLAERESYERKLDAYHQADCGFRIMGECGARAYPEPRGAAGAFLLGWSFPRWVELHAGIGFSLDHVVAIFQSRIRAYTWSVLDLIVVPRLGFGFGSDTRIYELSAMAGVRVRVGNTLSLYAVIGPGFSHTKLRSPKEEKNGFIAPFWGGTEWRF